MNMIEALRAARDSDGQREWLWARPVAWRGGGFALAWDSKHRTFVHVPTRGARPAFPRIPREFDEAWEAVSPGVVNTEGEEERADATD